MLELRRLRLLRELHERGTIAAVADALQFTPSAVSQQLAMLERETGVRAARAGRPRRAADRPGARAGRARRRAARARGAAPRPTSPRRRAPSPAAPAIAGVPVGRAAARVCRRWRRCAREAPRLRCELIEAEPEQALPALALGDVDLVLGDEWQHQPRRLPAGLERHELFHDPVQLVAPGAAPRRAPAQEPCRSPSWPARPGPPATPGMGWEEMTQRTCRAARRLRARHPPPHQRRHGQPRARRPRPRGDAAARPRPARRAIRASRCATIAEAPDRPGDLRRHPRRGRRAAVHAGAAGGR